MAVTVKWRTLERRLESLLYANDFHMYESLTKEYYEVIPKLKQERQEILDFYRQAALKYKDFRLLMSEVYECLETYLRNSEESQSEE